MTADPSQFFWPQNCGCYVTDNFESTNTVINIEKGIVANLCAYFHEKQWFYQCNVMVKQNKHYATSNMVPALDISLLSTDNLGRKYL